jgi:hypothetical protein
MNLEEAYELLYKQKFCSFVGEFNGIELDSIVLDDGYCSEEIEAILVLMRAGFIDRVDD